MKYWRNILGIATVVGVAMLTLHGVTAASSVTFGTTTVGGSTDTGDGNSLTCNRYTSGASGTITSLSAAVGAVDSASKNYSLGVYADSSNKPSTFLGSASGVLTANAWNSVNVSIPVTSGSAYWLCYNSSTGKSAYNNLKYAGGSTPAIYKDQTYGSWPAPFGTVGGSWTDNYSLYATVATDDTPPPPPPAPGPIAPVKLISRGVPAFASSGTASYGNDANYNTVWRSTSASATLTYNLASVPAAQRSKVLLVWYNEATEAYDPVMAQESAVNIPKNYTIQTNTAPSGSSAPASGWVTKATITSNKYHSRQHVVDMTGANWIRLSVTATTGGSRASFNMDVYDASKGLNDDWIIYGSSTPSMAMQHTTVGSTTQSFSQMINAAKPDYFPIQENGSISGLDTFDGVANINTWLSLFPGKYVGIGLGANDADECMDPATFYNNYVTMVNAVTAAGKVPVVPLFNWSKLTTVQTCGPALIDKLKQLYTDYPQVVKGPDFWTYFQSHPELISSDNQHPTAEGLGQYRQLWAQAALANVYQ